MDGVRGVYIPQWNERNARNQQAGSGNKLRVEWCYVNSDCIGYKRDLLTQFTSQRRGNWKAITLLWSPGACRLHRHWPTRALVGLLS